MGTPEFAVATLKAIHEAGWPVLAVVTAPDKAAGRGLKLQASAVKRYAEDQGIEVLQPLKLRYEQFLHELKRLEADLQVVVAFRMLPEIVWAMPPMGSINLHASLLPDYRGAAPINRAIMDGARRTGLSTFFLQQQIDTGDLLDQVEVDIGPDETAGELHDRMMNLGAALVLKSLEKIARGQTRGQPQRWSQDHPSAPKIFRADCLIDWQKEPPVLHNFIRGLSPYPGAYCTLGNLELKLLRSKLLPDEQDALDQAWQSSNGEGLNSTLPEPGTLFRPNNMRMLFRANAGWIEILELQPQGKKKMSSAEFLRGYRP